jgi:hypothetical protein
MSTLTAQQQSSQIALSNLDHLPAECQKSLDNKATDDTIILRRKSNALTTAVEKFRSAIRIPRSALTRHLHGNGRIREFLARRAKRPVASSQQKENKGRASTGVDTKTPSPPTTRSEERDLSPLTLPRPPFAVTTSTDSSISLSSQPETSRVEEARPETRDHLDIIDHVDHHFGPNRPATPSSQADTLHNSSYVDVNSSRRPSETQPPSSLEAESILGIGADHEVPSLPQLPPPPPPPPRRPFTPRLDTALDYLNVPETDDEDGYSTVREHSSSTASAVDFNNIGFQFDEAASD